LSSRHSEIEYKFPADDVEVHSFVQWCMAQGPDDFKHVCSPDVYYKQGENSIRHRWSKGAGELTVKHRKSKSSTLDREEIDLFFSHKTTRQDVTDFLEKTGWKHLFTVVKDAYVFWFDNNDGGGVNVCVYDCWGVAENSPKRRFIEIEAKKDTDCTKEQDLEALEIFKKDITRLFNVKSPVNYSLYELYTGKAK